MIIYKFTQGNLGAKKNRHKPISVASQEKKYRKLRHWRPTARSLSEIYFKYH